MNSTRNWRDSRSGDRSASNRGMNETILNENGCRAATVPLRPHVAVPGDAGSLLVDDRANRGLRLLVELVAQLRRSCARRGATVEGDDPVAASVRAAFEFRPA